MLRVSFLALFSIFTLLVAAQNYRPVDEGSKVHFTVKNFGINTGGDLAGIKGNIYFDPANTSASNFDVSVDVNTIDTDSKNRDEHLKGDGYFDAEKFPQIIIKSTKINKTDKSDSKEYLFTGTLTMHGITKNISFPFTATPQNNEYLFAGTFTIDRLNYGVGESSAVLSNTVKISLTVLAKKS